MIMRAGKTEICIAGQQAGTSWTDVLNLEAEFLLLLGNLSFALTTIQLIG